MDVGFSLLPINVSSLCSSDPIPFPVLVTSAMDHSSPLLPSLRALVSASLGFLVLSH